MRLHLKIGLLAVLVCCQLTGLAQIPRIDKSTLVEFVEHRRHEPLEFHQAISNTTNWVSMGVPAGLLVAGVLRQDKNMKLAAWNAGKSILISTMVTTALKQTVNRTRPFNQFPNDITKAGSGGSPSFPSGHTSEAFAMATSVTLSYPKWYVAVPAFGWASTVGYSRMYLGVHYPTDVLAGAAVGAGAALLNKQINRWYHQHKTHQHELQF